MTSLFFSWYPDLACMTLYLPLCLKFHPGAFGCLRSSSNTASGARQQCCYNDHGDLLAPGHPGAGTPDKSATYSEHQRDDVKPFKWCCEQCEEANSCQRYTEVRGGDNSHCKNKWGVDNSHRKNKWGEGNSHWNKLSFLKIWFNKLIIQAYCM